MIRISALRNRPVISGNRQIGFLQSISLDQAQKRVQALIVSRGMRGKCVVLPREIRSVGDQFILVDGVKKYERAYETVSCRFIRDTTGRLVGRIMDYAFQPDTMTVSAVEIMPGLLPPERSIRMWIYAYQRLDAHTLTIPVLLCDEPTFSEEGI